MKKMMGMIFAATAFCTSAVFAEEGGNSYPLYSDAVTFHLGFDGTMDASIAQGRAKPIQNRGKTEFRDGLRGKAVLCGENGGFFLYLRKKNIDFTKPGTMVFFYKPIEWEALKYKAGVSFGGIQASDGALYLSIAHDPVNVCPCRRPLTVSFVYGKKIPSQLYACYPKFPRSDCEKWHLFAFAWEPGRLKLSQDGRPWQEYPVGFSITEADFPNPAFCIGTASRWNYLLDEFTVYNRLLSDKELSALYRSLIP